MKKITITLLILILSISPISALTESNILYSMEEGYIDLTKLNIDIKEDDSFIPFDESMTNLESEMDLSGETGAAKTSVYFESDEDKSENVLRVDVDFTGNTLTQPVNTMFVVDQSGSMNMVSGQSSTPTPVTPCLHDNHAYLIKIRIDSIIYNYYHFPSESAWTGDWGGVLGSRNTILAEAKNHAISEGFATESSAVSLVYTNYFPTLSQFFHYTYTGAEALVNADRVFLAAPVLQEDLDRQVIEQTNFTHLDREIFHRTAVSTVWEFYSPVEIDTSVTAAEFIHNAEENDDCLDRMSVSKAVFHELSEIALTNEGNAIGYGNFAGTLHSHQPLGEVALVDEFLNTVGTRSTYYEKGLDYALSQFTDESSPYYGNQNLLIFVTDGTPNGVLNTEAELEKYMNDINGFKEQTDAIIYFVGIDIPDTLFNQWGNIIATQDSYGNLNVRNTKDVDDLLSVQEELEKILTSTTNIETKINEDFYMIVDADHPVEVTYKVKDNDEVFSEKVESISELASLGITYDETTGHIRWDANKSSITSIRLSFYKQFDESKVDWEKIQNGESLVGTSLDPTGTSYIDYSGREKTIAMDDTASYIIEQNSKLTITNTTSTPYEIVVGDVIDYEIVVKNTGTLTSDNNFVYQKIPEGTNFHSCSDEGIYDIHERLITFEIPLLEPGETVILSYSAVATEYDFEIVSHSKLGVEDEAITLDENGIPILSAEFLYHKTAIEQIDPPIEPEQPGGSIDTGDDTSYKFMFISLIGLNFIILLLLLKYKESRNNPLH